MPLAVILSLCLGSIACLTPLSLYLFWLAAVNRRNRPTPISGVWDFVAILCGLSGFLVVGVVLLLSAVVARSRLWGGHTFEEIRDSWGHERAAWFIAVSAVLVLFGSLVGLTLAARRRILVAYNTDLPTAETVLAAVLSDMLISAKRFGNLWTDSAGGGMVEVVPFHLFQHASFHLLHRDPRVREELDRRIRVALAAQLLPESPLAPWLTTVLLILFITIILCSLLVGVAVFSVR